jgi:hypothetical protein
LTRGPKVAVNKYFPLSDKKVIGNNTEDPLAGYDVKFFESCGTTDNFQISFFVCMNMFICFVYVFQLLHWCNTTKEFSIAFYVK